jgi:hypothetical protein
VGSVSSFPSRCRFICFAGLLGLILYKKGLVFDLFYGLNGCFFGPLAQITTRTESIRICVFFP